MFVPGGALNVSPYRQPGLCVPGGVRKVILPPGQSMDAMAPVVADHP